MSGGWKTDKGGNHFIPPGSGVDAKTLDALKQQDQVRPEVEKKKRINMAGVIYYDDGKGTIYGYRNPTNREEMRTKYIKELKRLQKRRVRHGWPVGGNKILWLEYSSGAPKAVYDDPNLKADLYKYGEEVFFKEAHPEIKPAHKVWVRITDHFETKTHFTGREIDL